MSLSGHSDACSCGSGKNFENCCGPSGAAASVRHIQGIPIPAAVEAATKHLRAGRTSQAEALYRQVLDVEPGNPDALHFLGLIAYQAGNNDVAIDLIGRAVHASPSAPRYANLGLALRAQGKFDAAVASYRKALDCHPNFAVAHNNLGNALADLGNLDESVAHLRRAIALKPDFAEAHANLGRILNISRRLDAMLANDGESIDGRLSDSESRSVQDLGASTQLPGASDNKVARVILEGISHYHSGNLARAETLFQCVRPFTHFAPDALHWLGMIAHKMGRTALALDLIGRAVAINSAVPLYLDNLEMVRRSSSGRDDYGRDCTIAPEIEIISATRMTEGAFWSASALGISLRNLARDTRLVARIAFENRRGLSEVFNEYINDARDSRILVFIHDDVWIDDFFFADRLIRGLEAYDVIGVAGNRRRVGGQPGWGYVAYENGRLAGEDHANLCGSIAHGSQAFGVVSVFGLGISSPCELMDGVFMAATKSNLLAAKVQFDPRFDFHFYDMDFCRQARARGLRLGTWPLHLTHQSEGAFRSAAWERMYRLYLEKWQS